MRCNRNQLADILGKDVKTIDKMVEQGMPYVSRPDPASSSRAWEFETSDVIRWATGQDLDLDPELKAARDRVAVAEAGLKELQYLKRLGVLHSVESWRQEFVVALQTTKSLYTSMPGRLAQQLAAEHDQARVEELVQKDVELALRPLDELFAKLQQGAAEDRLILDRLSSDGQAAPTDEQKSTEDE